MYRYYKYYSYVTQKEYQECVKRYSMLGAPPNCPRPTTKAEHDAALEKLRGLTPRKSEGQPPGQPPFGLGILAALGMKPVSRPYKQGITAKQGQSPRTFEERTAACKSRVTAHITRINANTNIPAEQKAAMIQKLNAKLADCSTPNGLAKEERDKEHKDVDNAGARQGQGQLVRQVTPGALRKNPNVIQSLIDAIWAFFQNIQNRPTPVDDFMAKYPKPAATA